MDSLVGLEYSQRLGFIINKNVLPPDAIEAFLRRQWECPHLATIPLDENAIRYFQEDKVPVAENPGCPFSSAVIPIVRRVFTSEHWTKEQLQRLEMLEGIAKRSEVAVEKAKREKKLAERLSVITRMYGTIVATALLGFLAYQAITRDAPSSLVIVTVVITTTLIFSMTASDPKMVRILIEMLFPFRRQNYRDRDKNDGPDTSDKMK
jgi:hypothetical protein